MTIKGPTRVFDTWTEEEKEEALGKMIAIASKGGHQSEMCLALGLKSEDTFYRWKRDIPEFNSMCEEAKLHSKVFYDGLLLAGASGKIHGFNSTAIMGIVNNKFPDDYKRGTGTSSDSSLITNNTTVNILSLDKDELRNKIQGQLQYLQQAGIELISNDDSTE